MKIRNKNFKGGYRFKNFLGTPEPQLDDAKLSERHLFPLKQRLGIELQPEVKPGDSVYAGQVLARNDEALGSPVLSAVNGQVESISTLTCWGEQVPAVVIHCDGSREWRPLSETAEWKDLSAGQLEDILYLSGTTVLGSDGIPTRFHSCILTPAETGRVIIKATESDVYNLSHALLLSGERFAQFMEGVAILQKLLGKADFQLVFSKNLRGLFLAAENAGIQSLDLVAVPPRYPAGQDEVCVPLVLEEAYPYGYSPAHLGVVVLDVQAVLQVYDAVVRGKPYLEKIITLSGTGFKNGRHVTVRLGTAIDDLAIENQCDRNRYRMVLNSALNGPAVVEGSVVDKDTRHLIALEEGTEGEFMGFAQPGFRKDSYSRTFASVVFPAKKQTGTNMHGERRGCLSCSFCEEVCPVGILPNVLHRYADRNIIDETLMRYHIFDCIGCNLCTYVCPSKIPVAQLIEEGKTKLREEGFDPDAQILSRFDLKGLVQAEEKGAEE